MKLSIYLLISENGDYIVSQRISKLTKAKIFNSRQEAEDYCEIFGVKATPVEFTAEWDGPNFVGDKDENL